MSIYDSESNAWTRVSTIVPTRIGPNGNDIFSKGNFYWATNSWEAYWDGSIPKPNHNCIVAFAVEEKIWTKIPLSKVCKVIFDENLGGCDGRVMLLYKNEVYLCTWRLIEGKIYEWRELHAINIPSSFNIDIFISLSIIIITPLLLTVVKGKVYFVKQMEGSSHHSYIFPSINLHMQK